MLNLNAALQQDTSAQSSNFFRGAERLPQLLRVLTIFASLATNGVWLYAQSATAPVYLDPKQPIEQRVDDLMRRMTLKEKVGQLNLPCVYVDQLGKTIPEKMNACRKFAAGT